MGPLEYRRELTFLGVEISLGSSQIDVPEESGDVDDVHPGVEQVRRGTGSHGGERQRSTIAVDERLPDGPHETLT